MDDFDAGEIGRQRFAFATPLGRRNSLFFCGFINGVLVARMKLPPFIVTLGMWQIVLATNFLYSANETIRAQDIEASAPILQFFGQSLRMGGAVFTYGVIAMVLLVALLWYVLNHTAWGRHLYAVGDDPEGEDGEGLIFGAGEGLDDDRDLEGPRHPDDANG